LAGSYPAFPAMTSLSVIVITYNEEPGIAACLQSVAWADEIVVVDCGSTDRTVALCLSFTPNVHCVARHGSGRQKQEALDKAVCPWVLNIDADEQVSPELKNEILSAIHSVDPADGFSIPRQNRFLGHPIRHSGWGDDRPVRLFRRNRVRVTDTQVHEGFVVEGTVKPLQAPLIHDAYRTLFQYLEKLNEYTSIEVRNRLRAHPDRRIGVAHFTLAPLGAFWKTYIVKGGIRDGIPGLLLCLLSSVSVLTGYAKLWEYQMRRRSGTGLFPPIRTEEVVTRQPGHNRLIVGGDDEFAWKDQ